MNDTMRRRSHRSRFKVKQVHGTVSKSSSRIAQSGSQAHSFFVGDEKYTLFSEDNLPPVVDGDIVSFDFEVRHLKNKYRSEYFSVVAETLTVAAPSELGGEVAGHVYILSNVSMPGLLKVGFTTGPVTKRVLELSGVTSVPTAFKVEWSCAVVGNARAVEQRAHANLARVRSGKEFFRCELSDAQDAVTRSYAELYPEQALAMDEAFKARAQGELARRAALAEQKAQMEAQAIADAARATFENTREGQWQKYGSVVVELIAWRSQPNTNRPGFIGKLLGEKAEDYIELSVVAGQRGDSVEWYMKASGRIDERSVHDTHNCATQSEAMEQMHNAVIKFGSINKRLTITVPNQLIENPPALPEIIGNTRYSLPVPSLDGLVIRPAEVKPRRSRWS